MTMSRGASWARWLLVFACLSMISSVASTTERDLDVTVVKISQRASIPADRGEAGEGGEEVCVQAKECSPGLVLPVWQPQANISILMRIFRAFVYLLAMAYFFFGVSIVADRFMSAIEVITSQEKTVKMKKITGESYTVLIRVWNETVSNLTLMALGSSAPEILLSVIEIFGNGFQAGDLGPSTIVGSAAFNLFVIIAICIWSIPSSEIRRIEHNNVFWVTVLWSTFAYVWLFLILCVISPDVIEVWEGVLTFLFFPMTVLTAYFTQNYTGKFGRRFFSGALSTFDRTRSTRSARSPSRSARQPGKGDLENGHEHRHSLLAADEEAAAFEAQRKQYLEVFRKLRSEHPDANVADIEKLATEKVFKDTKKSRAFYRIQATRKLVGAGDLATRKLKKKVEELHEETIVEPKSQNKHVTVQFEPAHYVCLESVGTINVRVVCDRGLADPGATVTVHYRTIEDTAHETSDYIPTAGVLTFHPGENEKEIPIAIVDNDIFEEDEQFLVRLSQIRAYTTPQTSTSPPGEVPARLGAAATATVLIVDDDHAGAFGFENESVKVPESSGTFVAEVLRTRGARGRVRIPFRTEDGKAQCGKDYISKEGVLEFVNEQSKAEIEVEIVNDDEYEKSEDFYIELGEPEWLQENGEPMDESTMDRENAARVKRHPQRPLREALEGRPCLNIKRVRVVITEDKEFKNFVDRMLLEANTSFMVGTSSWKQQFAEAMDMDEDHDGTITRRERIMHYISLPWKLLFALIPPTDYANGWLCFVFSIVMIGVLTAFIGDLASHFGCTVGLKDSVTAISLVAMGTSVPDTFASRTAALGDSTADSSIVNVTGSNAVNVFLGIGIAWAIAAVYHAMNGNEFRVNSGSLAFSVTLFLIGSALCIFILQFRRFSKKIKGELGGPAKSKTICAAIFICTWLTYLLLSTLEAYCVIPGF